MKLGKEREFWLAFFQTVESSFVSFLVAFTIAFSLSVLAHRFYNLRHILAPLITTFRSAPTIAVILILLMTIPWGLLTFCIAFLVTFPLLFSNILASIESVPCGELEAGRSLGMRFLQRTRFVYVPNMRVHLWANITAAFGLNLKVVIAAEVLGIPSVSIGFEIMRHKQMLDYQTSFTYLCVAVLLAWGCDKLLKAIGKRFKI
jgi:NitT/TauT family transport system permease protein